MLDPDSIDKFCFHCVDTNLGGICPDAQNIREICNLDLPHGFSLLSSVMRITVHFLSSYCNQSQPCASWARQAGLLNAGPAAAVLIEQAPYSLATEPLDKVRDTNREPPPVCS
jgi:hypothetical protein